MYKESHEDFVNPERGFYIPSNTKASHFKLLDTKQLIAYRTQPQQPAKAGYKVQVSLLYRGYELDTFKNQPLSERFLSNLQNDFDVVRSAGLKMILRFAYTNTATTGDCKDEYKICPPYGDAPKDIVLLHVQQLKPLLQKNADVIAVMQEGFIGIWGENYFTDYFGDASTNAGKLSDSSWKLRNQLLKALLDALPKDRMIQVRTPQIKQKFVYGPTAPVTSAPLTVKEAFTGTDAARIGFHNDCLLASADDFGTYYDYGSSTQPRKAANKILRKYIAADTRYTVVGGETCDDGFSPQNDCAPVGHAEQDMKEMHYSYLNAAYNNDVNNDWDSAGCMYHIKRKLGYRFTLKGLLYPTIITARKTASFIFTIDNSGYAAVYNERPVQLVFKNKETGETVKYTLDTDLREWFGATTKVSVTVQTTAALRPGEYELFLFFPDKYPSLEAIPAYAIRLANMNIWDATTGFNKLDAFVTVK